MVSKWHLAILLALNLGAGIMIGAAITASDSHPSGAGTLKNPEMPTSPRIGYFNITKVMNEYHKVSAEERSMKVRLRDLREEIIRKIKDSQPQERSRLLYRLSPISFRADSNSDGAEEPSLQTQIEALEKEYKEAERALMMNHDRVLVDAYRQTRIIVAEIAVQRGLDSVEAYTGCYKIEDETNLDVARKMLEAPPHYPFYISKDLDLTDEIIERLNKQE